MLGTVSVFLYGEQIFFIDFYCMLSLFIVLDGYDSRFDKYGGWESSTRCNFRKHMQIEKAPANQENIFISLTAGAANALNTNK